VGSGRRGDVSVEGDSGGVAASSGVVLRLEAEAWEGTASAASERDEKHGAGENFSGRRWATAPFKGGGGGGTQRRGAGESGDAWGRAGERGGPGRGGKRLGRLVRT
jgi:hypothetical protein